MNTPNTDISLIFEYHDYGACERISHAMAAEALIKVGVAALEISHSTPGLITPETSRLVQIANDRSRWTEGHEVFDALRRRTLLVESEGESRSDREYSPMLLHLLMAENLARIIYNFTTPDDPFDNDSAAWFVLTLAEVSTAIDQKEIIRSLLSRALDPSWTRSEQ